MTTAIFSEQYKVINSIFSVNPSPKITQLISANHNQDYQSDVDAKACSGRRDAKACSRRRTHQRHSAKMILHCLQNALTQCLTDNNSVNERQRKSALSNCFSGPEERVHHSLDIQTFQITVSLTCAHEHYWLTCGIGHGYCCTHLQSNKENKNPNSNNFLPFEIKTLHSLR